VFVLLKDFLLNKKNKKELKFKKFFNELLYATGVKK
jgi:hypothetical protein